MRCSNCPLFSSWSNESDRGEACRLFGDSWDDAVQYEDAEGCVIGCSIDRHYIEKHDAAYEKELKKRPMQNINSSVEWGQLVDAVDRTNDLRSRFGYTYVPIWATLSHGEQARHDARKVFYEMPKCLQDFIGSPGAMLQYAREMENMDHTGMQIRRRDYEKWRQDNENKYSLPELIEMVGLLPEEERMLLGNE